MCGIAGVVELERGVPADEAALQRMAASLYHRGPDASGIFVREGVGLAHARLSVIDLVSGDQPMLSDDRKTAIVFNGEVYNFRDLREALMSRGLSFRTSSDTEVLLRLFESRGLDAFKATNAQLACAIWDGRRDRLVLARDRLGKKPLYYYMDAQRFVFGSELKAIIASGHVDVQVSTTALCEYLTYGYICGPKSILSGVERLLPGEILTLENGCVERTTYWAPDLTPSAAPPSERDALREVDALLRAAVARRMIADVPLGAFLSGGLDSSLIVALMAELAESTVRTFSVGFREADYSELEDARRVATHVGTNHTEIIVTTRAVDDLDDLIWHYDEPFADSSMIPTFYVCRAAREHVTVALSGDGGDEVFAGYDHYLDADRYGRYPIPPRARRFLAEPLLRLLPFSLPGWNRLYEFAHSETRSLRPRLGQFPYIFASLVTQDLAESVAASCPFTGLDALMETTRSWDPVRRYQAFDVAHYLPGDILTKIDRASMAVSLEVRSPLLDHELFDYVARLPTAMKLRQGTSKWILRALARDRLPPETLHKAKQGFAVPIQDWFRGELNDFARDVLLDRTSRDRGYFRPGAVGSVLDLHAKGGRDYSTWIWTLLVLELWHRSFVDQSVTRSRLDESSRVPARVVR